MQLNKINQIKKGFILLMNYCDNDSDDSMDIL